MEYRIAQSQKYLGNDYWSWSSWIEASPDALQEIDRVVWILHPTFRPSRIERRSRETQFRLDTAGWGTFRLRADLHKPSGELVSISHMLELAYPNEAEAASSSEALSRQGSEAAATPPTPYVFLSYSSEDAAQANAVREAMQRLGVRIREAKEITPGLPFEAAVRKMIRESSGVMGVLGSDYASPYVIAEMKLAEAEEKPAIALLPEGVEAPLVLSTFQATRFGRDLGGLDSALAGFAAKLGTRGMP